jgi:hypothetical protein
MRRLLIVVASLVLLTEAGLAQNKVRHTLKPLNDTAMDSVTAGGVTAGSTTNVGGVTAGMSNGVLKFQGSVPTKNGLVTASGSMSALSTPITSTSTTTNTGSINLSDTAQQNLTSLVNINAVNSNVNVLLNLNVNINSTVGTLTQTNMGTKH